VSEEIPNEALIAFANAYKFSGITRMAGNGKLEFQVYAGSKDWATIDLVPGLRAALKALALRQGQ
jgi:hypothetical protein